MPQHPRVGLGLSETGDAAAVQEATSEITPESHEESSPQLVLGILAGGTVVGVAIGYVAAIITPAIAPAHSPAFLGGLFGFVVASNLAGMVRKRRGRLVFDWDEFSKGWGKKALIESAPRLAVIGALSLIVWILFALIDGTGVRDLWVGVVGLLLMLPAVMQKELRQLEFWRASAKRIFSALAEKVEDVQVAAAARKGVKRAYRSHSESPRLSTAQRGFGTALMILGVGVSVLMVPDVLRYVVQPRARLTAEPLVLAIAAMMIVGGWFLRQRRTR